jgi:hypothetical protein
MAMHCLPTIPTLAWHMLQPCLRQCLGSRAGCSTVSCCWCCGTHQLCSRRPLPCCSLLLLGFVLPLLCIWRSELRQRRGFMSRRLTSAAAGPSEGGSGGLMADRHAEPLGHLPGWPEFASLCGPAVAAMYM